MKPKRLAVIVLAAGLVAAAVVGGAYYGTLRSLQGGPAYTKPAVLIEKWDGPGAPPVETAKPAD